MNSPEARSSTSAWSTAAVIVAIVAVGTVVAGLLNDPQSDPVAIPGCEEVIQPEDMQRINYAFVDGGSFGGPGTEWFTESKAAAMSSALVDALPDGTAVQPNSSWPALIFDSIGAAQEGTSFGGDATAYGKIERVGMVGDLTVTVRQSDEPPGPCFAGAVDERLTLDDGTVVDTSDGETRRRVIAYAPDGTRIDASADGVLTLDQLIDIAATPGLRASD